MCILLDISRSYYYKLLEHVFYSNHLNIETKILNYKCQLTNNEYRIMDILIKNLDNFVSTESIMIELWNDNIFIEKIL